MKMQQLVENIQNQLRKLRSDKRVSIITTIIIVILLLSIIIGLNSRKVTTRSKAASVSSNLEPLIAARTSDIKLDDALSTKGVFLPQDQSVASVNSKIITNRDLNFILYQRYFSKFKNVPTNTTDFDNLKRDLIQESINDEVLLQSSANPADRIISSTSTQEYRQREVTIFRLKKGLEDKNDKYVVEMVSVWFYNVNPPEKPLTEANDLAFKKIDSVHNDVMSGKLTMRQAGAQLASDTEIATIDKSWVANSYYRMENIPFGSMVSVFEDINSEIWKLKPDQISTILKHPTGSVLTSKIAEQFYIFTSIHKMSNNNGEPPMNYLNQEKTKYSIKTYSQ